MGTGFFSHRHSQKELPAQSLGACGGDDDIRNVSDAVQSVGDFVCTIYKEREGQVGMGAKAKIQTIGFFSERNRKNSHDTVKILAKKIRSNFSQRGENVIIGNFQG